MAEPTAGQAERIKLAIAAKAARLLKLPTAPLGVVGAGEMATFIGRDNLPELLYGLRYKDLDIDDINVTVDELIAVLGGEWPEANEAQLEAALDAAKSAVAEAMEGMGIA